MLHEVSQGHIVSNILLVGVSVLLGVVAYAAWTFASPLVPENPHAAEHAGKYYFSGIKQRLNHHVEDVDDVDEDKIQEVRKAEADRLSKAEEMAYARLKGRADTADERQVYLSQIDDFIDESLSPKKRRVKATKPVEQNPDLASFKSRNVECKEELAVLSQDSNTTSQLKALHALQDTLMECLRPEHRSLNKSSIFASSMLANGGLDTFQTLCKSEDEQVRQVATFLMEKTVPLIWQ